jgi:hypothetical protein
MPYRYFIYKVTNVEFIYKVTNVEFIYKVTNVEFVCGKVEDVMRGLLSKYAAQVV